MNLPHKFTWDGEAWVAVSHAHRAKGAKQCEMCQQRSERERRGANAACVPLVSSLPHLNLRCGHENVIYIRDSDEGWAEYMLNILAGES